MDLLLRLLASLVLCACSPPPAFAQAENSLPDYVVSWQGDTIRCRMITAAEAKKMPLVRRERFWTQLFLAWDSSGRLRTYRPGDLKAFHRKKERYKNLIALFIHYNFERAGRLHNLPERYKKILGIP